MRALLALFLMLVVTSAHSQETHSSPTVEDVSSQNALGNWQGKIGSASSPKGPFVDLSFLYLKPNMEGLTFGQVLDIEAPAAQNLVVFVKDRPKNLNFQFEPGLYVGLGYIFPQREQWEVSSYWTYLYSTASNTVVRNNINGLDYLAPAWLPLLLGSTSDRSSAHWNMNFNLLDFSLSRNAFFGQWLSLKPSIGIRTAWINQDYTAKYHGGFIYTDLTTGIQSTLFRDTKFEGSNDYWGVGTHIGSDFQWYITKNFSILGNFFLSLLYGDFKVDELYDGAILTNLGAGPALLPEYIDLKKNFSSLQSAIESEIGLQWHQFFKCDRYRLLIGAFYQFRIWFDQNKLVNQFIARDSAILNTAPLTVSSSNNVTNLIPGGNLTLQGLRIEGRLDF